MDLPPVAVRTAYWLARELSPESIAFTRAIALDEIEHPTAEQREYAKTKYDLALRIAQQPLEGPELACPTCLGTGVVYDPGFYVPGVQFCEPPTGPDMCGTCLGTGRP